MKELALKEQCPNRGAKVGETHRQGCSIERCPFCGRQMLQDNCCYTFFGIDPATMEENYPAIYTQGLSLQMGNIYDLYVEPHRLPWDGAWPGVRECREYGLWSKWTDHGWETCSAEDPDASEDLNTLAERSTWDKEKKRYVITTLPHLLSS